MQAAKLNTYWQFKGPWQCGAKKQYLKVIEDAGYNSNTGNPYKLLHRIEVGLLCYEKCTNAELRKFAKNRGTHKNPQKGKRVGLIRSLMSADEHPTFPRFMDLAPELRNNVYEQYLAEFPALTTPAQPPLARLSRQVRHEALSSFYACCSFKVHLIIGYPTFDFPSNSLHLLEKMRAVDVARLSNLSLDTYGSWSNTSKEHTGSIDVTKGKDDKYAVAVSGELAVPRVQTRLRNYFEEQKLSTGEKKLEIEDIWAMRRFLEQG